MKKSILFIFAIILSFCFSNGISAQSIKKIWYDSSWTRIDDSSDAVYYRLIKKDKDGNTIDRIRDFYITGEPQMVGGRVKKHKGEETKDSACTWYFQNGFKSSELSYNNKMLNGWCRTWDSTGQILDSAFYINDTIDGKYYSFVKGHKPDLIITYNKGYLNGPFIKYYANGQVKRNDIFVNGRLKKGMCFDSTGKKVKYYPYETDPVFPKGNINLMSYIENKIVIPEQAKTYNHQGVAYVHFEINEQGFVKNIKVLGSTGYSELDKEAVRVIKGLPRWMPATRDKVPYAYKITLPVVFRFKNSMIK